MANPQQAPTGAMVDAVLAAANVLMRVAARSVVEVEDSVSSPQLRVLVFVSLHGAQSAGAIARELDVHASNATRICDRLIRLGFLIRSESGGDRRFVRLELTSGGAELVSKVFEQRRNDLATVFGSVPASKREAVMDAFRIFAAAADVEGSTDGRFALGPPQKP